MLPPIRVLRGLRLRVLLSLLLVPCAIQAKNVGADPPAQCPTCSCPTCAKPGIPQRNDTSTSISRTEGNLSEQVPVSTVGSAGGTTIGLTLTYNSYNADGSRASVDTVMGYGWTHSFNMFLFTQFGAMFEYDGTGRVTKFGVGPGGTFITAPGYFETLARIGSAYTLTTKNKTVYTFATIAGSHFVVGGPVWLLTSIVDRNGNTTTLSYSGGNLAGVTDTYGRTTTFTYNTKNTIASVADPIGRTTTFTYDSTGAKLTQVTDPNGNSIQYGYNSLYQLTGKTDKAGRTFTYSYSASEPTAVKDSASTTPEALSNPGNWATNATSLAANETRTYTPATTTATDGRGNTWTYQYDSNGYLLQTTGPDSSTTTYTYDPSTLLPTVIKDADLHTTHYSYDTQGNLLSTTDALGDVTIYTYEPTYNMMTSMTDPRGRPTTYTYDSHGNRLQETDPLGQTRSWTYDGHGNKTTATDKDGHVTTYQYDSSDNLIKTIDAIGNTTTYTYDGVGNMLSRTDADGHTTSYQYDGLNRPTTETDALGHVSRTTYDGEGNRTQFTDRNGHTTMYQYDLRQRLTKTTDAVGNNDTYTYDGNDNRISSTDRDGHTTTYQYDVQNRLGRTTDALGNQTGSAYDGVGNMLTTTDANTHTTTYTYDALNRRATATDAASEVTQYQYDTGTLPSCSTCGATPGSGEITGTTDGDGNVTYYKYDALDRRIDIVRKFGSNADTITPSDAVTTYTYDAVGNRLTLTEPDGNTTTSTYDADNRLIEQVNAAGDTSTTTYDPAGNVSGMTAPNGNVTAYTYDALNRLTETTDSAGLVSAYSYDPVGNRLSAADGNTSTYSYGYDALNRIVTVVDPLGQTTTTSYDQVGNPTQTKDRNGNTTTSAYDAINRCLSATDALGHTTQYQYDPVGNLLKQTDANLDPTQYSYDAVNRRLSETYADGLTRRYTYDSVGNILTRTDQDGQVTTYTYDPLYRLTARAYPYSGTDSFTYDLSGRMLSSQRGSWTTTMTYDGADRIVTSGQNGKTTSYSYNIPLGTRTLTYPGGRVVTENTDPRNRISHIDGTSPDIVRYTYDPGNRVTGRIYFNDTSTDYAYNSDNWVSSIQHVGGSTIAGFMYGYDNEGNKQYEQKTQDQTHSEAYQYDYVYRLLNYAVGTLSGSTVPSPATQTAYSLDPVGNWNSKITNSVTQTRVHNVTNELTEINSTNLIYDNNGNLLNDGAYTYAYDEENRLTTITRQSDSAVVGQYQYDALSRRVQKIADPAGTSVTTRYFYDGPRAIEEQDTVGSTQATYVFGNYYIDEVLTMDRGGQTYYYYENAMGSIEAVADSTGTPVERYSYDAYGLVTVTSGSFVPVPANPWGGGTPHSAIGNPLMFTARQLDEEAGLYFYRARYYDPNKGRFIERDPDEYADGMNLYQYGRDNPVRYVDPSGTVTGSFTGGETRGETGGSRPRGQVTSNYTLTCTCSDCSKQAGAPCWRMACAFSTTAPITLLPDDAVDRGGWNIWDDPGWDARYGNTERTRVVPNENLPARMERVRNSRVENARSHERDHQQTTQAFDTYNRARLAGEERTCHASEKDCNDRRERVLTRVRDNFDLADAHSRRFDSDWNTGNQYADHPLENQRWLGN